MQDSTMPAVLLIDDNNTPLESLEYLLRQTCRTIPTLSEVEARERLRERRIRVIVHDSSIPPRPGTLPKKIRPEFMQDIRREHPRIRFICYYGIPDPPEDTGDDEYVSKDEPEKAKAVIIRQLQQALLDEAIYFIDLALKEPSEVSQQRIQEVLERNIRWLWQHSSEHRNFRGVLIWLEIACKLAIENPLTPAQFEAIRNVLEAIQPIEIDEEVKLTCGDWLLDSGINLFAPMGLDSELIIESGEKEVQ